MILPYNEAKVMFESFGLALTDEMYRKFDEYAELLVSWNEKINLTAITDAQGITEKHFLDSTAVFKYDIIPQNSCVIDVGTGAGFPGIPMKIYRDDLKLTLLDSLNKRIGFLSEVSDSLSLGAACIHSRAEDGAKKPELREQFDIATARAVASAALSMFAISLITDCKAVSASKPSSEKFFTAVRIAVIAVVPLMPYSSN